MRHLKYLLFSLLLLIVPHLHAQVGPLPCGAISSITTWRPDFPYSIGQVVILNGVTYSSLVANNLNQNPCTYVGVMWSNIVGGSGTSSANPPQYSVQFASATNTLSSDSTIAINPFTHTFTAPQIFVPGSGVSGLIGLIDSTTNHQVSITPQAGSTAWTIQLPAAPPFSSGMCQTSDTTGVYAWQTCLQLTGGTLTGALFGTTLTFSGALSGASITTAGNGNFGGNIAAQNAGISGTITSQNDTTTTLTAQSVNTVLNPLLFGSGDIGQHINATVAACSAICSIRVPAGAYSYSNTIVLPLNLFSQFNLQFDDGAKLTYSGSGDAIYYQVGSGGPTEGNCKISGGQLVGNTNAVSGIHVMPTNTCTISSMLIYGFANGAGVWFEGSNGATLQNSGIFNNKTGVLLSPTYCTGATCSTSNSSGAAFSPNAIHIQNNSIVSNTGWGVQSTDPVTNFLTGALNDTVENNDMETNGTGAIFFGRSYGLLIQSNYFEASPTQIRLGLSGGTDGGTRFFASWGTSIVNNYFTGSTATPTDIQLDDTQDLLVEGNTRLLVTSNNSNCFLNSLANSGANVGEKGTYLSKNSVFFNGTGNGNYICIQNAGVSQLAGTNSFQISNTNYNMIVVNQNYQITSTGTSETVTTGNLVSAASACLVGPFNSAASAAANSSYYIPSGANTGTLYHPSGVNGARVNIFCSIGPLN